MTSDQQVHELGDVDLQHGTLPGARIVYKTHGSLNAAKSNAILFPTWYGGQHPDLEWIIGPDHALDPRQYFIVGVNIVGNGMSSSPSNQPAPYDRQRFPRITIYDNVMMQRRLLSEKFGIEKLLLVVGRSMGAQLAFQWGALFPDMVERILALCGSARTSPHNYVFLQAVKMALMSDPAWNGGDYQASPINALRRMQLTFDSWGLSQTFYRQGLHLQMGFDSTDDFLNRAGPLLTRDVNDFIAQVRTWEVADISDNHVFKKDFGAALKAIKARAVVMPSRTDLYFPPEDSEIEVAGMPNAELRILESVWGHRSASPGSDPADIRFFEQAIRDLLARA
jgi:homoserine O-acetyltransferase